MPSFNPPSADVHISIIVPTFNERENLGPLIASTARALSDVSWELIVVDDQSSDGTADFAYEMSRRDARVRLILRVSDRGLARSTLQGMLSAKGSLLCVMDGDGQHDPAVIPLLVDRLDADDLDIVSAARQLDGSAPPAGLSSGRLLLSRVGNQLSTRVIRRDLSDPLTGFFVIRRSALLAVAPQLGDPGFKLLLDILHSGKTLRHAEVPFAFGERRSGASKLDSLVAWQFATFLLSKTTGGIVPASLISFLFVGGSGLFVHFAALYGSLAMTLPFTAAQIVATLTAATSNFLLNNLLTFRDRRLRGWRQFSGYLKFLIVSSVGIVANVSAATIAHERIGHGILLSTLAGIAIDTIWKFTISRRIIWR